MSYLKTLSFLWLVLTLFLPTRTGALEESSAAKDPNERIRVIIQLSDDSLARYRDTVPGLQGIRGQIRTTTKHLDVGHPAAQRYVAYLKKKQKDIEPHIHGAAPGAALHWRYQVGFNGIAATIKRHQMDALRRIPGVVSVTEAYTLEPDLDTSRTLINLNGLWTAVGTGSPGAGAGRRVALIDSGVNANHQFFNDAGFTAPAGYPKSYRDSGGVITNLDLATYTNDKVIVANVYNEPGDNSGFPFGAGSDHGTHVAGIMAGREGVYTYSTGNVNFSENLSGMAPGAYIMSYRLNGDTSAFLAAIEDVIADQADALNISLGHSRWLTSDADHDPVQESLEGAAEAGVVVAVSSGNAGANGASSITGSFKYSDKILTVGNSSHNRIFANPVSITGPGTPDASLQDRVGVASGPTNLLPIGSTEMVEAPGGIGADPGEGCGALPAATGKIVIVVRGTCTFAVKQANAAAAGAIAFIVVQNAASQPAGMAGLINTIPGVMVTRTDGRNMTAFLRANPGTTTSIGAVTKLTAGWPDVMDGSSSKGPTALMTIKPDITGIGGNVLSSVVDASGNIVGSGAFEQFSGTSMATPHITGIAALTKALHPTWTPQQIKSAILNNAVTTLWNDIEFTIPSLAMDRGAGRVNASGVIDPHLTFDPPSVSFGLHEPGESQEITVHVTDMRNASDTTPVSYNVTDACIPSGCTDLLSNSGGFTSDGGGASSSFSVTINTAGATNLDYEGFITIEGGGQTFTIPYFVRVIDPASTKDVLLIDWDASGVTANSNFQALYTSALTALGLTFDVVDGGAGNPLNTVTLNQLQRYGTVIMFNGNNPSFPWSNNHGGGSFPIQDYIIGGGRFIAFGQDVFANPAFDQNVGRDYNFTQLTGWMDQFTNNPATCAVLTSDRNFYGTPVAADVLVTTFDLFGRTGDISVNNGGTLADPNGRQLRPDSGRLITVADRDDGCRAIYNAENIAPHSRPLGSYITTTKNGVAAPRTSNSIASGVAADPTLENPEPQVSWNAALMHVGLEGLNINNSANLNVAQALDLLYDFVNDEITGTLDVQVNALNVDLTCNAVSSAGRQFAKYRWDFGDGSPIAETTTNSTTHTYVIGDFSARCQAITELTRSAVFVTGEPISTFLFHDDFVDGSASDWTFNGTTWQVVNQSLVGTSKQRIAAFAPNPWPQSGLSGCSNCTITASVETAGKNIGVLGWRQNKDNFVRLSIDPLKGGKYILSQHTAAGTVGSVSLKKQIPTNTTLNVELRFDGANFVFSLNGQQLLVLPMAAGTNPFGNVGFEVQDTTGRLHEIIVR